MHRLLEELVADGILDAISASWATQRQAEQGGAIDTALLELEVIDEDGLLRGLQSCHRMKVARPSDLENLGTDLAKRLPPGFSKSFFLCPVRLAGNELVAFVQRPLAESSKQELQDLFGLKVRELLAPEHYLAVATSEVYGAPLAERHRKLRSRLAKKHGAPALDRVITNLANAPSFAAAVAELLDFATRLVDYPCLLVSQASDLRVAAARRAGLTAPASVPFPGSGSSFGPAIAHGGYFLGPLVGSPGDRQFYDALGRPLPRCAFVAPVPRARAKSTYLYADNGERGIAARWIAELTVLIGRLGQKSGERRKEPTQESPPPAPAQAPVAANSDEERVLGRLRVAAAEAQMDLPAFVEELLRQRDTSPRREPAASALIDEAKIFFEKLAADIPAHLARGMQAALRDMGAPRSGASAPLPVATPAASVELVQKPAARSEPVSYAARRQKAPRLKL